MTDDELRALVPHTAGDEPTILPGSDSALDVNQTLPSEVRQRRNWAKVIAVGLLLTFMLVVALKMGFYTIQPIGALPEGRTLIVWRDSGEPLFNSPDAMCMDRVGEVSLLCRGVALTAAPVDRIVLRLPYMDWAYLLSTGGKRFER